MSRASAAGAWAAALAAWEIPSAILAAAPEPPWGFPPALFEWSPERAAAETSVITTSRRRALEALPEGGSVLDVGVGGGRGSLPLVPPGGRIVGVDASSELLEVFARAAHRLGVTQDSVLGMWPDVAGDVGAADVVVCHHVAYNVADLVPFAQALTDHARSRVVLEVTATHPMANLNDVWRALHGLEFPTGPTASDAVAVLEEMGLHITAEADERRPRATQDRAQQVAFVRRRLCVGAERDPEIDGLLGPDFELAQRQVVTIWWDGHAG